MGDRVYELEDPAWERQAWESESAHEAFLIYRDLGRDRRVSAVGESLSRSRGVGKRGARGGKKVGASSRITRWATEYRWTERARAWDNELRRRADEQVAVEVADWEADLARKRLAARRRNLEMAELLDERVKALRDSLPIVRKRVTEGGKTTIIEPLRVTQKDLAIMAKFASDLRERGLEPERSESGPAIVPTVTEVRVHLPQLEGPAAAAAGRAADGEFAADPDAPWRGPADETYH
jgi:hypothetical protein